MLLFSVTCIAVVAGFVATRAVVVVVANVVVAATVVVVANVVAVAGNLCRQRCADIVAQTLLRRHCCAGTVAQSWLRTHGLQWKPFETYRR